MAELNGILIMISSMALFASKDGVSKHLLLDLGPAQIVWIQYTFTFTVLLLVTARRHGWRALLPTPFGVQLLRGLASVGGVGSMYWALSYLPLADATAMALTAPLIVTALSPFLLRERIGIRRILAVLVGFSGVLVILRPGFGGEIEGYLIGLLAGTLMGVNYLGNRHLAGHHPQLVNIAHSVLFGVIVVAPVMPQVWVVPPPSQYLNLAGFLVITLFAQSLMITAFRYAPASVIAPYQYTAIVFSTVIGYLFFGTFPDLLTGIGIAMIIGGGVFIALRERALTEAATGAVRDAAAD